VKERLEKAERKLEKFEEGKNQERLDELEEKLDNKRWKNDKQKKNWENKIAFNWIQSKKEQQHLHNYQNHYVLWHSLNVWNQKMNLIIHC